LFYQCAQLIFLEEAFADVVFRQHRNVDLNRIFPGSQR
jgi:hypothetical protein